MSNSDRLDAIKSIIRKSGRASAPSAELLVTEVRSEGVANVPMPPAVKVDHLIAQALVIEWSYRLPWTEVEAFHKWLAANEAALAKALKGAQLQVAYCGTYVVLGDDHYVSYRTYWSYDHPSGLQDWDRVNQAKAGELKKARDSVIKLRRYWCRDPDASERRYAPAHLFAKVTGAENAFLALTLEAAKGK
jgi:hypothetical protein